MYPYVLGIVCCASFVIAFGFYTSQRKASLVKKVGLALALLAFTTSVALFVGFDLLAEKVYISSETRSSKTFNLIATESPNYYLIRNSKGYNFSYIGKAGSKMGVSVDFRNISDDGIDYDKNATPQVVEEETVKGYYKKWLFIKSGTQYEECIEYKFTIPSEENILYESARVEQ